jgi:hypothetical protein
MHRVQPAMADPVLDRLRRVTERLELGMRDRAFLLCGDRPGGWLTS